MTAVALVVSVVGFVVLGVLEWRSRRRVRSVPVAEVTPEAIRYVSLRAKEDGR